MNKVTKGIIVALSVIPGFGFAQTVTIDVKADVHAISPYIYGSNEDCSFTTSARWGGNRSTTFNWENNASNGGNDFNNVSDAFYDYTSSSTPALPIVNFVKKADSRNQFKIVTVQAAGYVAADKDGKVTEAASDDNPRWKKISFEKPTPYSLTPDTEDDVVYIDEMINYLQTLGEPGNGGIDAYAVDNEPFLWSRSHPLLHPEQTTYQELFEKTKSVAHAVHKISPNAEIVGPMFYGWTDAHRWGDSRILDEIFAKNDNYYWFVDFYLDSLRQMQEKYGEKYLDIISFHWYPEATGTETRYSVGQKKGQLVRIVNTSVADAATPAELVQPDVIEARLQAPRTLWDNTYKENSYVGTEFYQIPKSRRAFLKNVRYSIDHYYPGTKIAFTEFEYDAEGHWSGGLALADVLGIFGREDVYLATKWNTFQNYSTSAYKLYLDYDGNGNGFGSTSVQDIFTDTVKLASYASLDEEGNLHIIAINKTNAAMPTNFVLNNGVYSDGVVYGFGQNSADIKKLGTIDEIQDSKFVYNLPAYSAVHIILNVIKQTELVKAQLFKENELTLTFADNLSLVDETAAKTDFVVMAGGTQQSINKVEVNDNQLSITLDSPVSATEFDITVSYSGTSVMAKNNLAIDKFDDAMVTNELPAAEIIALAMDIDPIGKYIKLTFSKQLSEVSGTCGLNVINGTDNIEFSCEKSADSDYELFLYPTNKRIVKYNETTVSSVGNSVLKDINGVAVSDFSFTQKAGANYSPNMDSVIIADNFIIKIYFDANMLPETDYSNAGLHVIEYNPENSQSTNLDFMSAYNADSRILTITTVPPMLQGRTYTLKYDGNDIIQTIHHGVLEGFEKELENNLTSGGSIVDVPGVIQADEFWFQTGGPVKGVCSDDSELGNGTELGYTNSGDYYTYFIKSNEAKKYTLTTRYSADRVVGYNGQIAFIIDGGEEQHLMLPATGSFTTWADAYRVVDVPAGDSIEFKLKVVSSGFNLNYFNLTDEERYPEITLTKAYIHGDGDKLFLIYDKDITVLPEPSEIVVMSDTNRVNITNYEYVNNDKKKIYCYLESKIYKGQAVTLSYKTENGQSLEGTILPELKDTTINNNSKLIKPTPSAVSTMQDKSIVVSPNPVKVGQNVTIQTSMDTNVTYQIVSNIGSKISEGNFTNSKTISFDKPGIYFITIQSKENQYTQKIIVE